MPMDLLRSMALAFHVSLYIMKNIVNLWLTISNVMGKIHQCLSRLYVYDLIFAWLHDYLFLSNDVACLATSVSICIPENYTGITVSIKSSLSWSCILLWLIFVSYTVWWVWPTAESSSHPCNFLKSKPVHETCSVTGLINRYHKNHS